MAATAKDRRDAITRAGGRCEKCGHLGTQENGYWLDLEVDHIQQEAHGGGNSPENLRVFCLPCHDDRHGRRNVRTRPVRRNRGIRLGVPVRSLNLKLPEDLHALAKMEAARRRKTLQQLVEDALRAYVQPEETQKAGEARKD